MTAMAAHARPAERRLSAEVIGSCHAAYALAAAQVFAAAPRRRRSRARLRRPPRNVRLVAQYLTVVELNIPARHLALAIGVSHAAVSANLRRIEDERDDPAFDALVEQARQLVISLSWIGGRPT